MAQEYQLVPSPIRREFRRYDPLSGGHFMYSMLLRTLYVDETVIIGDLEVGLGVHSIELRGTSSIVVLGDGRLAIL